MPWLLKSEPEVYSIDQLSQDGKTNWDHIRNFQARNFLRQMRKGDLALIYHSGGERRVVGVAKVIREAYPDLDSDYGPQGDWSQVDIQFVKKLKNPVDLAAIKATPSLKDLPLIRQSRLSTMPVSDLHFELLCKMGGA
ncbi:MAG: EVE domain-containing protein [Oligoflexia bacterium]